MDAQEYLDGLKYPHSYKNGLLTLNLSMDIMLDNQ